MASFFVNRPIVAMVMSIIIVMLGLVAMQGLPIAQYPEIVPPMVQVTTTFIGASATDVEASVATPLEQQINGVEKGIYLKSTNANDGTLTLKVSFEVGSDLDMDNVLTQNRVSQAMPQMPQSVKNYGVTVKKALAFPLLVISVKSPNGTYDSSFLSNYTTININDAIARIPGVGQINLFGGSDYAMRVWLRPDVIGRLGVTIPDIANAIAAAEPVDPGRPDRRAAGGHGHRVHLHRPHAGPPAERGGIRQHHHPDQPERVGGPAEGRRPDRAGHDALQRRRAPRRQAVRGHRGVPDSRHQRARRRRPDQGRDGQPVEALPARHGVPRLARHDAAGVRGHRRNRAHALRSRRARDHRRLHLSPELARDADSADDRARVARRRVHVLPAPRLLDQRALAARPRARHRHRRGRCDCGGRSGDAPHRARDGAEGSDDQGDGRGVGPGHRHRADSERGVRAGGLHGRHHRAAVSAVRDHHCHLRAAVGHQRADAQPGARRAAAEAGDRQDARS